MKSLKMALVALAMVALAVSAMAIQNQVIWVTDGGGGISLTPVTSTSGVVTYTGNDSYWTVVVSTGTAYPPATGQGTLGSPVMDLTVAATSSGISGAGSHPLSITFGADGYGPTSGTFASWMTGHLVSGTANSVLFNTYDTVSPIAPPGSTPPAGTLLTTSGAMSGPLYNSGTIVSSTVALAAPYGLEEYVDIQAAAGSPTTYSLDGSLLAQVPDGGATVMLLGVALAGLGLIERRLA